MSNIAVEFLSFLNSGINRYFFKSCCHSNAVTHIIQPEKYFRENPFWCCMGDQRMDRFCSIEKVDVRFNLDVHYAKTFFKLMSKQQNVS